VLRRRLPGGGGAQGDLARSEDCAGHARRHRRQGQSRAPQGDLDGAGRARPDLDRLCRLAAVRGRLLARLSARAASGAAVSGIVYLVGAGPGDPSLLTVRARELLGEADVVAYDELCSDALLGCVPATTELLPVGRRGHDGTRADYKLHPAVL